MPERSERCYVWGEGEGEDERATNVSTRWDLARHVCATMIT